MVDEKEKEGDDEELVTVRLTRRELQKWQDAVETVERVGWILSGLERFAKWAAIMAGGAYILRGMFPQWFGGPPTGGIR